MWKASMRRFLTPIVVVLLGVSVALGVRELIRSKPASPPPVPAGDYEIAWIHTTTSPQTWERLVAAAFQIKRWFPGVQVDDSRAFLDQTAAVPEVVFTVPGRSDKLHIRWYKLSSEVNTKDWVKALSTRNPAPIAFMGGSSSDRAIELAQALNDQADWKGSRPLLFITTATADADINPFTLEGPELIKMYPDRTFRGCFTDSAMARAVIDFIWRRREVDYLAVFGGALIQPAIDRLQPREDDLRPSGSPGPQAHVIAWEDDPYSLDLAEQFGKELRRHRYLRQSVATIKDRVAYSVGTFTEPNPPERDVLNRVLADLAAHPDDRSLLILPAVTQPARRAIRALAADSPLVGWKQVVAVTGDGVSFNTVYRDGDVAWPVQELSIPFVFFAHEDPVAWSGGDGPADTASLAPPSATDDVLQFADMIKVIAEALYLGERVTNTDELANKIHQLPFYGPDGERRTGQGEYVVVLRPQFLEAGRAGGPDGALLGRVSDEAVLDVFTRVAGKWVLQKSFTKRYGDN
jgi:hypothetical protein